MYKISVPVLLNGRFQKEKTLSMLSQMEADRVFLAIDILSFDPQKRAVVLDNLKELIPYFKSAGLEVGVWLWTFWRVDTEKAPAKMEIITGFGGNLAEEKNGCGPTGNINSAFFCPSSKEFIADTCDFLKQVAELSPDLIMFDDDYRFGNLPTGFGCCCDNHLKMMSDELGETVSREGLPEKLFCGGKNRYRDAWLNALGASLKNFAKNVREVIDTVNPEIRIAMCACLSNWGLDGVDAYTVTKILAGNTKPILRLIGAPYWPALHAFGQSLQGVIELERMESAWCDDENIEIMSEGDVYPRPRHRCPSSYLEGFDTAIRAAEATTGILKYTLSYTSAPEYENGYVDAHVRNKPIYKEIERLFKNKKDCGVRIYEFMSKVRNADLPKDKYIGSDYMQDLFHSPAAKMLSDNTIPTSYTAENTVGVAFGENVKYIPEEALENGLIIDIKAAGFLMEKGIDVGIEKIGSVVSNAPLLHFKSYDEYVESNYGGNSLYDVSYKNDAEVLVSSGVKGTEYTDAVYYENEKGQKFVVFSFDAYTTNKDRYRSYAMQNLLFDSIAKLGSPVVARCKGNPDLYILCREDEKELSVGLWNFFADSIENPVIELAGDYSFAEFVNCNGKMGNGKITLSKLSAFEFAFIKLTK